MTHGAKIAHCFLVAFAAVLSVATVASLFARFHWVLDTAANFRVQGIIAIAVLGTMALLLRQGWIVGMAASLLLVNLSMMNFGSMDDAESSFDNSPLRFVTTNVLSSNPRHDDIINELRAIDGDVMVVIELNTELANRLRVAFHESHPFQFLSEDDLGNFGIGISRRGMQTSPNCSAPQDCGKHRRLGTCGQLGIGTPAQHFRSGCVSIMC